MPRSAIIGVGFMGQVHARAVRAAGGVVTAVAGRTAEAGRAAVDRLHAARAVSTITDIFAADDVDLVHICTPNHLHEALTEQALAAGKHVICEKPLAPDPGAARRLAVAATEAQVVAAVPFVYRFYPTLRDARDRVRRGDVGTLRLLHGSYLQDWLSRPEDDNWRVDPALGGASRAFGDIGVHWCDAVEFVTGHRITRLSARTLTIPRPAGSRTEDGATVIFETDRGALGSLVISQISPGRKNRLWLSIDGAAASLQFDQELPDSLWIGGRDSNLMVPRGTIPGVYDVVPVGHPQGYQDCFTAFVSDVHRAIAGEPPDGLPTFEDGLRAAEITAAVLSSAATEAWVDVARDGRSAQV
jgi:predicted dehydrogenase